MAQDSNTEAKDNGVRENADTDVKDESQEKRKAPKSKKNSDGNFEPTEEISEDLSISFPIDI